MNDSLTAQPGRLYAVATPVGNLSDLTERARAILGSVDLVACEDTRVTGALLARLEIPRRRLVAHHDHNETASAARLADEIAAGKSVAVVSDAGTPAISDPGFRLVRECRRRGLPVVPVPGPCAFVAALSVSGLPTNAVQFAGFLPPKAAARAAFLRENSGVPRTLALYESCHRVLKLADDILEILGPERVVCFARELTKLHETILTGPAGEVAPRLRQAAVKGEFTVLIAPAGFTL
ncbi:MAG: 16S rRNA (cytidine(1402)-2'-O)-methyltransferase [Opitutaceae bacterium]|jgi:16S rRNA (cytidine1402-2'-O)-methyltransferase|nr:16S rRNA (cytidine(1402)-2'-O)-methyltransferase [Opitutaceae bacterium]